MLRSPSENESPRMPSYRSRKVPKDVMIPQERLFIRKPEKI